MEDNSLLFSNGITLFTFSYSCVLNYSSIGNIFEERAPSFTSPTNIAFTLVENHGYCKDIQCHLSQIGITGLVFTLQM